MMYSFFGDIVLDPFAGSGTTSKAALDLGRKSIGIEINPNFLSLMEDKIGLSQVQNSDSNDMFEIINKVSGETRVFYK